MFEYIPYNFEFYNYINFMKYSSFVLQSDADYEVQ